MQITFNIDLLYIFDKNITDCNEILSNAVFFANDYVCNCTA